MQYLALHHMQGVWGPPPAQREREGRAPRIRDRAEHQAAGSVRVEPPRIQAHSTASGSREREGRRRPACWAHSAASGCDPMGC